MASRKPKRKNRRSGAPKQNTPQAAASVTAKPAAGRTIASRPQGASAGAGPLEHPRPSGAVVRHRGLLLSMRVLRGHQSVIPLPNALQPGSTVMQDG